MSSRRKRTSDDVDAEMSTDDLHLESLKRIFCEQSYEEMSPTMQQTLTDLFEAIHQKQQDTLLDFYENPRMNDLYLRAFEDMRQRGFCDFTSTMLMLLVQFAFNPNLMCVLGDFWSDQDINEFCDTLCGDLSLFIQSFFHKDVAAVDSRNLPDNHIWIDFQSHKKIASLFANDMVALITKYQQHTAIEMIDRALSL